MTELFPNFLRDPTVYARAAHFWEQLWGSVCTSAGCFGRHGGLGRRRSSRDDLGYSSTVSRRCSSMMCGATLAP